MADAPYTAMGVQQNFSALRLKLKVHGLFVIGPMIGKPGQPIPTLMTRPPIIADLP
jgi:hypothetical protein